MSTLTGSILGFDTQRIHQGHRLRHTHWRSRGASFVWRLAANLMCIDLENAPWLPQTSLKRKTKTSIRSMALQSYIKQDLTVHNLLVYDVSSIIYHIISYLDTLIEYNIHVCVYRSYIYHILSYIDVDGERVEIRPQIRIWASTVSRARTTE